VARSLNRGKETVSIDCRLDRQSFIPLYQQIKNWFLSKIEANQLLKGDAVPSEAQLSEALRVSRATVRQAFYELRLEGYVVREKGRGTFIGPSDSSITTSQTDKAPEIHLRRSIQNLNDANSQYGVTGADALIVG
jgi:DNA-binding GntR family transcriptional regulator